eukprot:11180531-Lingulodinium_polyedra.AAC.1
MIFPGTGASYCRRFKRCNCTPRARCCTRRPPSLKLGAPLVAIGENRAGGGGDGGGGAGGA